MSGNNYNGVTRQPLEDIDWGSILGYSNPVSMPMNQMTMPDFGGGQPGFFGKATDWLGKDGNLSSVAAAGGALMSGYLGMKNYGLAKDNLNFQKQAYSTNLGNSIKSYNTGLEDRINGRTADYAGKAADVQSYLDRNKMTRG
ncbi:MAG: hypothetical protein ACOH2T_19320 [Pseudomonas sp.]